MKQTISIDLNELGLFNGLGENSIWISEEVDYDLFETVATDTGLEEHTITATLNEIHYLDAIADLYVTTLHDKLCNNLIDNDDMTEFKIKHVSQNSIQIEWTSENAKERFETFLSHIDMEYNDHHNPRAAFELYDVYEKDEKDGYSLEQSFYEFTSQSGEPIAYSQMLGKYFLTNTISLTDTYDSQDQRTKIKNDL